LDLISLQEKARTLSDDLLDRDIAEISTEIDFLEEQVRVDLRSYSPKSLEEAHRRIAHFKQRAEILKIELARRSSK